MIKTLGGAEFDPDDGFTAKDIFDRVFPDSAEMPKLIDAWRTQEAVAFRIALGEWGLSRYPVLLLFNPN